MARRRRTLSRILTKFVWDLVTLPFVLIYRIVGWLLSGRRFNNDGYMLKKTNSGNYRLEHRLIAEEVLGRRLERWEVVHHINGRRDDNGVSNLCVMSRVDHDRYHAWYKWVKTNHKRRPARVTQLKKLRETFRGELLAEAKVS